MTVTLSDVQRVWRMVDEDSFSEVYDQATISGYLTDFDEDKNAVASVIWMEKAAALQATTYDISADDASYKYSQRIDNAKELARYYASRRTPTATVWTKDPDEDSDEDEVVND
jgi:hypothetical protein